MDARFETFIGADLSYRAREPKEAMLKTRILVLSALSTLASAAFDAGAAFAQPAPPPPAPAPPNPTPAPNPQPAPKPADAKAPGDSAALDVPENPPAPPAAGGAKDGTAPP